jgi:maleylacetoacetate isomerase
LIYRENTEKAKMKLYNYFRSSASYRVRIGLNLKNIAYDYVPVHLVKNGGEQFSQAFLRKNPMAQLPCLEYNGHYIAQSMAILFYLDELKPNPRLFPVDAIQKAKVIEICELINSGIQPLQNLAVLNELGSRYSAGQAEKNSWSQHWINKGLTALEKLLSPTAGTFCFGNEVSAADCFLIPQMFASRRMGTDLSAFPTLLRIEKATSTMPPFQAAEPSRQIDFSP